MRRFSRHGGRTVKSAAPLISNPLQVSRVEEFRHELSSRSTVPPWATCSTLDSPDRVARHGRSGTKADTPRSPHNSSALSPIQDSRRRSPSPPETEVSNAAVVPAESGERMRRESRAAFCARGDAEVRPVGDPPSALRRGRQPSSACPCSARQGHLVGLPQSLLAAMFEPSGTTQ